MSQEIINTLSATIATHKRQLNEEWTNPSYDADETDNRIKNLREQIKRLKAIRDEPVGGLVVRPAEGRSWDFRPFGQSPAVRKHRVMRSYLRSNAWKIYCGTLSRRAAKKAARRFAERAVADDPTAGCKCAVRMGSRTWIAVL